METHQQQAIDSLQELVRSLWPDALIDIYGSSYTQLALPVSDIDCVLVARSLAGERPLVILEALAAEVERQPWTKKLELLGSAKIPVLKMTYSLNPTEQDVLLDLTCGHSVGHTGLGARDLIYSLQTEMPALRPLVLILKSHLVNNIPMQCSVVIPYVADPIKPGRSICNCFRMHEVRQCACVHIYSFESGA
ncbi:hypothetical protein AM588_10011636 [Phytophthora nicotianae]|uniref:Poly(A) RNA polymerase mitochondrial-like central palm domain-containing protein n=1 Tax=Phytophthora nicotianae TaxID=4792 RepID=A0A0W8DQ10_PHYNI|nr:hypothetical protein AM588_10011636 [Phytophthora nicotianae]